MKGSVEKGYRKSGIDGGIRHARSEWRDHSERRVRDISPSKDKETISVSQTC